ncbi:unnamed protein product [Pseudo-nitzschia multistriata]|uniref:Uncharacterized protein n=1 Tax=Pseudo-nitzschia multistriata TaxID=183589 RepID=A0A448ZLT9_9STRA|nr:unnamed protein product [Pseudo-nitzschia multistriata]
MGDEGPELQMALFKKTEQKSVPNVFVKQQHIGGNDDTQAAAAAGKLQELLGFTGWNTVFRSPILRHRADHNKNQLLLATKRF